MTTTILAADPKSPERRAKTLAERTLVVGSWPGQSYTGNEFIRTFVQSLADAGCKVVDVTNPGRTRDKLDVLHIHWPELVFWNSRLLTKMAHAYLAFSGIWRMKRGGTRVVWMVHNLHPHELKGLPRLIWPCFERFMQHYSDAFMTLAPSTIGLVRAAHPALASKPAAASLHPVYQRLGDLPDRTSCRNELSLPDGATVFALLGLLRPYKGAEALIATFGKNRDPNHRLLIAGNPITDEYGAAVRDLASADSRIQVKLGFLKDLDFAKYLQATDFVVLPYQNSLHSGAMVHALSYGRAVIAPSSPFTNDVAQAVGEDWVIRYSDALSSAIFEQRSRPTGSPDLTALEPQRLGRTAADLYRRLLAS